MTKNNICCSCGSDNIGIDPLESDVITCHLCGVNDDINAVDDNGKFCYPKLRHDD